MSKIPLLESPLRKEVQRDVADQDSFEICNVHERVNRRLLRPDVYTYIHLKEDDDGSTYWEILQQRDGEFENYTIGKDSSADQPD